MAIHLVVNVEFLVCIFDVCISRLWLKVTKGGILILIGYLHNMVIWEVLVNEYPDSVRCMKAEHVLRFSPVYMEYPI